MNSFIWRKKNITGGSADTSNLVTLNSSQTISGSKTFSGATMMNVLHMNNTVIDQLANPNQPQNAATKAYVDNKAGDWIQIGTINSATSGLNSSSFVDQTVTNVPENFTLENQSKYEVLLKINVDSSDIFNSTVIGVNSNTYNNVGMFTIPWGNSLLWVYLTIKNGSVSAKYMLRQSGTNWNTPITIFMRKVG